MTAVISGGLVLMVLLAVIESSFSLLLVVPVFPIAAVFAAMSIYCAHSALKDTRAGSGWWVLAAAGLHVIDLALVIATFSVR